MAFSGRFFQAGGGISNHLGEYVFGYGSRCWISWCYRGKKKHYIDFVYTAIQFEILLIGTYFIEISTQISIKTQDSVIEKKKISKH